MRRFAILVVLAACGPSPRLEGPAPAALPALRDLGTGGGLSTWRLQVELPAPGYILVVASQGTSRPRSLSLSIPADQLQAPGRRLASVNLPAWFAAVPRYADCRTISLHMWAVFPVATEPRSLASLAAPAFPSGAGAVPVMVEDPVSGHCSQRAARPRDGGLYLLVSQAPISEGAVEAAMATIPAGTTGLPAVHHLAAALGATVSPAR